MAELLGLRCPAAIFEKARAHVQATESSRMATALSKDKTEKNKARATLFRLFPRIPHDSGEIIAEHAFEKHSGREGRSTTLAGEDNVTEAVITHIRHVFTNYEHLLQQMREEGVNDQERHGRALDATQVELNSILKAWRSPVDNAAVTVTFPPTNNTLNVRERPHDRLPATRGVTIEQSDLGYAPEVKTEISMGDEACQQFINTNQRLETQHNSNIVDLTTSQVSSKLQGISPNRLAPSQIKHPKMSTAIQKTRAIGEPSLLSSTNPTRGSTKSSPKPWDAKLTECQEWMVNEVATLYSKLLTVPPNCSEKNLKALQKDNLLLAKCHVSWRVAATLTDNQLKGVSRARKRERGLMNAAAWSDHLESSMQAQLDALLGKRYVSNKGKLRGKAVALLRKWQLDESVFSIMSEHDQKLVVLAEKREKVRLGIWQYNCKKKLRCANVQSKEVGPLVQSRSRSFRQHTQHSSASFGNSESNHYNVRVNSKRIPPVVEDDGVEIIFDFTHHKKRAGFGREVKMEEAM